MANYVHCYESPTLASLETRKGELVLFVNHENEVLPPVFLGICDRISRGFQEKEQGIRIIFQPFSLDGFEEEEKWTFYPKGRIMVLWKPKHENGILTPDFRVIESDYFYRIPFPVEDAYSGIENVKQALRNYRNGFEHYASLIESRRLRVKRGLIGALAEKTGLGFLLGDELKFR